MEREAKNRDLKKRFRSTGWVILIILALSAIEPVLHLCIARGLPDAAPSGLHNLDTYAYMSGMIHYQNDYYSPYAACHSNYGQADPSLYALPHHHLYGLLGMVATACSTPPFLLLGLANGLGLGLALLAAWLLLRQIQPRLALRAFVLFSLAGGAGGLAFCITGLLGWHTHPEFSRNFLRFFVYELNEGARFQPWLLAARLYYTLPLALGFSALACLDAAIKAKGLWRCIPAALLLGACAFLNMRIGPMLTVVGWMLLLDRGRQLPRAKQALILILFTLPALAAVAMVWRSLQGNPELNESVFRSLSGAMWLLPFLYASCWAWLVTPGAIVRAILRLPLWMRLAGGAGLGYAMLFSILYLAYQGYYGNWLYGGHTSAAISISNWAFLGLPVGALSMALWIRFRPHTIPNEEEGAPGWIALWFLAFFCGATAAWGQGWFLQFMPQRFMVVLGLPLALLFAEGLTRFETRFQKSARALYALTIVSGILSILVTWGFFYGPWGYHNAQKLYPWTRCAYISKADATLMQRVEQGVVLCPSLGTPLFGDLFAQRPEIQVVYGNGTMDFSHQIMPEVRKRVADFFSANPPEGQRKALIKDFCVRYVYCPDSVPVAPEVLAELEAIPWLDLVGKNGRAMLFEVLP